MHDRLFALALTSALVTAQALAAGPTPLEQQQPAPTTAAQPGAASPPPAAGSPAEGSLDEVICEIRKEPYTGTHISYRRKVCKTRREWEEEKRIADRVLEKVVKGGDRKNPQGN